MTLTEALPRYFEPWIRSDVESWDAWRMLIRALDGLPLGEDDLDLFNYLTGLERPPEAIDELWVIAGRRSGKSLIAAILAVWVTVSRGYEHNLVPGEMGVVAIIAVDNKQAKILFRYIKAIFQHTQLGDLVGKYDDNANEILLKNGLLVAVLTNDLRRIRGRTIVAAILDEVAYWWSDEHAANPDVEVIDGALRPAMATVSGSILISISSPYAKRGVLWETYREHFGQSGSPIMVVKAPSQVLNPTLPDSIIRNALRRDRARGSAEYMAEFRDDVQSYVNPEVIDNCTRDAPLERAYNGMLAYTAVVDPAGGSGQDSFTLAIGHVDPITKQAVIDLARETKPPFSPDMVVREYSQLCRQYRVSRVHGDRYAGEWPRERFRKHGIGYEPLDKPKSEIYLFALPELNAGLCELPPIDRLKNQFANLERRTARSGKDAVDHPRGAHDDVANAVAALIVRLKQRPVGQFKRIKLKGH